MTFEKYQEEMKRTAPELELCDENLAMGGLGIAGEAGEVADYIKKVIFHKHDLSREKLAEELGDVLWYLTYTATIAGFSMSEIAEMNIRKLRKRYPEGFDEQRSINRDSSSI